MPVHTGSQSQTVANIPFAKEECRSPSTTEFSGSSRFLEIETQDNYQLKNN